MRIRSWQGIAFVLGIAFWLGQSASQSFAGLLPVSVTVTPDASNYRFTYGVVLTSDSELHTGDYFTIYDFAGFVPGSNTEPAGFAFSSQLVGPTPGRLVPEDSPSVSNLTWTYTGPDTVIGQEGLGNFMALSTFGNTVDGFFTATTHRQVDGRVDSNITDAPVPVPSAGSHVPEPASLILLACGVPFAGALGFRRKK